MNHINLSEDQKSYSPCSCFVLSQEATKMMEADMELVSFDDKTMTIKMNTKQEFAKLLAILRTASTFYSDLDSEALMLSEAEVETLAAEAYRLEKEARP